MTRATQAITKVQLIEQFDKVVADTEQLLKTVANAGGEQASALRASAQQSLTRAKEGLRDFQQVATDRTKAVAEATDEYVHQNPWRSLGAVAGLTAVLGLAIGLMLNRR